MAIVINGSGTVTGISVGGLPDGIVDAGTLATNSVDSAELIDGSIDNSHIDAMAASKLTGALPAIDGSSLTGLTSSLNDLSDASTSATSNIGIGSTAVDSVTTGSYNVGVGTGALTTTDIGNKNSAIGYQALYTNGEGGGNVASGYRALYANTIGDENIAVGQQALYANTEGLNNVACGFKGLHKNTTGNYNTTSGTHSLYENTTGEANVASGGSALYNNTEGDGNTGIGYAALYACSTGSRNQAFGKDAGRTGSPGGNVTTGNDQLCLGDENITDAHVQVDWTVASDQRDKTDFTALDLGLDFVNDLEPVTYKWDKRSKYGDKEADDYDLNAQIPDGTHKEDWLDIGFKAQEVEALEIAAGYDKDNKTNLTTTLSGDGKQYGLQYSKFVPILVKAVQELSAENEALSARITALENA
jgi:hypothetical protein